MNAGSKAKGRVTMPLSRAELHTACLWAAASLACSVVCHAQDFPSRPIRLIVPQAPGGGTDILGRNVAQRLGEQLRQPAVVENRVGAGSLVGTEYVARASADGYTLLVGRPGKLTYGSAGIGTLQHVWGTILFRSLGLDVLHVPFKGAAAAHQEMMAGRLDMMFDNMSASKQYVQSGRLKGLAVSSASRSGHLPEVPTVSETGLVKFEAESWFGLFAPAGTPAPVVEILRKALTDIIGDPEFAARIERDGGRVLAIPPQQQQQFMREQIERWTKLVTQYGVTVD